jgi:hypothetical protein
MMPPDVTPDKRLVAGKIDPDGAAARLWETLDALEAALRTGDLAALGVLEIRMQDAADALERSGVPAETLARLRGQSTRIGLRLAAARDGVAAARLRLADIAGASQGLGTYDRSGARQMLPTGFAARTDRRG